MATDNSYWIKFYLNLIDDPKFARLTDTAKAVYFELYILAGRSDAGGLITAGENSASPRDIAWQLRRGEDLVNIGLSDLEAVGLISIADNEITVTRYADEQGPAHTERKEQWRTRQERHREKAKIENSKELKTKKELNKDKDNNNNRLEGHADVTRDSRVTSDDDDYYDPELIKYISQETAIPPTETNLKELKAKGLTFAEIRLRVEDRRAKGYDTLFASVKGLADWKRKLTQRESWQRATNTPPEPELSDAEREARDKEFSNLPTTSEGLD
jgi:hypothetical protein